MRLVDELGPAEAARRLEMPVKSLNNWVRLSCEGKALASDKHAPAEYIAFFDSVEARE